MRILHGLFYVVVLSVAVVASPPTWGQERGAGEPAQKDTATRQTQAKLPVRRVVLYKNGVGYFEHLGRVRGSQDITIDFTSDQLNDVLQSLTILDLGGGQITGVSYNSEAPLGRRLGALRLPLGEQVGATEFLRALRGARLEVRSSAGATSGRLLSVERKTRISGGTTLEVDYLTIITDGGEVRGIELGPGVTVRLAERDVGQEVGRYLSLLASTREQDVRRMMISTSGSGDRQLYVSYISEVPIWKATYRLVLPSKPDAKPLLQGWAIVDNTVGEEWNNVQLSLVAGAPQSFIQKLSQPYYARRPVVALPESTQLTPQTHESTLIAGYGRLTGQVKDATGATIPGARVQVMDESGAVVAEAVTDDQGNYVFDSLPTGSYRVALERTGFRKTIVQNLEVASGQERRQDATLEVGTVSETVTVTASPAQVNTESATIRGSSRTLGSGRQVGSGRGLGPGQGGGTGAGAGGGFGGGTLGGLTDSTAEARARLDVAAQGRDLGDLFEYKLKQPVTIRKGQSALVPIVHAEVAAEKVSLWSPSFIGSRPRRALWVTNTSPLTLDSGSFSVLESETFAGEGLLDAIKPGEKRLLTYAADLGLRVELQSESEPQHVTRVRIARGVMIHTNELHDRRTYTVRNEDATLRTLVLEHPVRPGWKLVANTVPPEESSAGMYRFRLRIESKKTATFVVDEAKPVETRYELTSLTGDQVALFLRQRTISPEVEQALRRILDQKDRVAALEEGASKSEAEMDSIFDDQQRIRENLKALKGSAEEKALTERYILQLSEQETRLETLRREKADLTQKQGAAQAELEKMIRELSLDVSLSPSAQAAP